MPYAPSLEITRVVRRLRGGSQAFEVEGLDGQRYAAKFCDNPQGNRTLANEWFAAQLLSQLGLVSTPRVKLLTLSEEVVRSSPDLYFSIADQRVPIPPGLHFGSQIPVQPHQMLFDCLPRRMYNRIANVCEFGSMLALDLWLAQSDKRQALFARAEGSGSSSAAFRAMFIDFGLVFRGCSWNFDGEPSCWYHDRAIYDYFDLEAACRSAMSVIRSIRSEDLFGCAHSVPRSWLHADGEYHLIRVVDALDQRRHRLEDLLTRALASLRVDRSAGARSVVTSPVLILSERMAL